MRVAIPLLVFSFLISPVFSQWERTAGPEGISISSMNYYDGVIYAGTSTDGLFGSWDDGLNWEPLNSGIEYYEVTDVEVLPGYLFAGTFGGGVYRSTDSGASWLPPSNASNITVTSMVVNDTTLFAGSYYGIYRSSNHGEFWEQIVSGFDGVQAMGTCGGSIFASIYGYTIKSTDNGENWGYVDDLEGAGIWNYYSKDSLLMAGAVNEIYKSTDYGNTFAQIPMMFSFGFVNINTITSVGEVFYAGTSFDGVYSSGDGGYNWEPANEGMGPKDVRAMAATDATTLVAGSNYVGVYRSTNMAFSWEKAMDGFPAGSSIISMHTHGNDIFAGTRDGIYKSTDNGDTWMELHGDNDTINYSSVRGLCEKNGVLYAGMDLQFNAAVYSSDDEGDTWIRSSNGLPGDLTFITGMVTIGDNILASTDEGVFYSPDDGASWYLSNSPVDYIPAIAASDFFAYIPVSGIGIMKSPDNGINWNVSLLSPAVDWVEVAAYDIHAYAGTFFAGARYSPNNGTLWYESNGFPYDASVFALHPFGEGTVLAGTDLGPDWVYMSYDNGVSYSAYSEGLGPNAPTEVFAVNDTFMFAGTAYNGIWTRLRPEFVDINAPVDIMSGLQLHQNSPNPFREETLLKYELPEEGPVTLEVCNLMGERIALLVNEWQPAGQHQAYLTAEELPEGVYLVRLSHLGSSRARKIVHTR